MPSAPIDHPNFEPSHGLSEAPLTLLLSYLSKEVSTDGFAKTLTSCAITPSAKDRPIRVLGFVSSLDADEELRTSTTPYGRMTSRCLNFTVCPSDGEFVLCVHWARSLTGVSWRVSKTERNKVRMTSQFCIRIPWLEAIVQLAITPLIPLISCLKFARGERAVGIDDEILKRISVFNTTSNAFYFQNVRLFLAWEIARRWPAWDDVGASIQKRLAEVREAMAPNLTVSDFNSLLPEEILCSMGAPAQHRLDRGSCTNMREAVSAHADRLQSVFSRGGDWDEFLCRTESIVFTLMPKHGAFSKESEIEQGLWWWKSLGDWPVFMQEEFRDNWARSAFLYELRARLLPTRTWDIFQSSWFHLDVSQRGVLYYLWPPDYPRGKFWRQGRIYGDNQAEHDFVNVPVRNPAAMREEERAIWEEQFRGWKHDLLGQPLERKQRSVPKKGPNWDLLEAMDRSYYFPRVFGLTNLQIKHRQKAKMLHADASKEAGLLEDSSFIKGD